jgi:GxxExxY protein
MPRIPFVIHVSWERATTKSSTKDAFAVELSRAGIPFSREQSYEISYKGVILPHSYYADFVVWNKILFEARAVEKLTDSHINKF